MDEQSVKTVPNTLEDTATAKQLDSGDAIHVMEVLGGLMQQQGDGGLPNGLGQPALNDNTEL